jgi:hypothetical protein
MLKLAENGCTYVLLTILRDFSLVTPPYFVSDLGLCIISAFFVLVLAKG